MLKLRRRLFKVVFSSSLDRIFLSLRLRFDGFCLRISKLCFKSFIFFIKIKLIKYFVFTSKVSSYSFN